MIISASQMIKRKEIAIPENIKNIGAEEKGLIAKSVVPIIIDALGIF